MRFFLSGELEGDIAEEFINIISEIGSELEGLNSNNYDRVLASRMGEKAVDLILQGIGGHCVGVSNNIITHMPIEEALNMSKESKKDLYRLFERLV